MKDGWTETDRDRPTKLGKNLRLQTDLESPQEVFCHALLKISLPEGEHLPFSERAGSNGWDLGEPCVGRISSPHAPKRDSIQGINHTYTLPV